MFRFGKFGVTLTLLASSWVAAGDGLAGHASDLRLQAERRLLGEYPRAQLQKKDGRALRVYGAPMSGGASPVESAERFREDHAWVFGLSATALGSSRAAPFTPRTQPVLYQPETGDYKFTLVRYPQQHEGIQVFRGELKVLVRNVPEHPVVWAGSGLRELPGPGLDPALKAAASDPAFVEGRALAGRNAALTLAPGLSNFGDPQLVVWGGLDDISDGPRLALAFHGDDTAPGRAPTEVRLFLTDLATGAVLHTENRIFHEVSGNVSGRATEGIGPDICESESPAGLPHLKLTSGSETTFSDSSGDFVFPLGGSTVDAALDGIWFDVVNVLGPELAETAPSTFDLVFNQDNDQEFERAQVNAYVESNRVRDFVLNYNPAYPTFTDTDILVRVNRTDGFCPGNAWYAHPDGGSATNYSINFCAAGSGNPNTSWSSIVHHEFGHHLVEAAGSGQGQYGEGMGDVMSVLILDSPAVGLGFFNDCGGSLRSADNNYQYPCNGGSHSCGQLISGSVWSTRNKLVHTEPTSYTDVLANLAVNAMLLHSGSTITPGITIDYLILDDDDGVLLNGTPHYEEINAGFGAHNMPAPQRAYGLVVAPQTGLFAGGPGGGPFSPDSVIYTLQNAEATAVDYVVTPSEPWLSVTNAAGTLAPNATVDVTVSIGVAAATLPAGLYLSSITIGNSTTHLGDVTWPVQLAVDEKTEAAGDVPLTVFRMNSASSTITVAESFCVGDLDVAVDLAHGDLSDLTLDLQSPSGTVVRLVAPGQGSGADLLTTYDDEAGSLPHGPGTLEDLDFANAAGDWILSIENGSLTYGATLRSWSLEFGQFGATCPPRADDLTLTVPSATASTIVLAGQSTTGGVVDHVITALPTAGSLQDPGGAIISTVPYSLPASGTTVTYTPSNGHVGPDEFFYRATDGMDSAIAAVRLQVGNRLIAADFPFDVEPGWSKTGDWAFGQPTGGGSHSGDPTAGKSGSNVWGFNLSGDYASGLTPQYLTTGAIDLSSYVDVEVSFWRWLGIEAAVFDGAAFEVSTDGAAWTTVWRHAGDSLDDGEWIERSFDISTIADGQPTVYLRWVMGGTDGTENYPGWNLDDVRVTGALPPSGIALQVSRADLSWTPLPSATAYDLIRGDLTALRASGGEFLLATDECLADDIGSSGVAHTTEPSSGEGFWYLVRGATTPGPTTYDSFGDSQHAPRDLGIEISAVGCP